VEIPLYNGKLPALDDIDGLVALLEWVENEMVDPLDQIDMAPPLTWGMVWDANTRKLDKDWEQAAQGNWHPMADRWRKIVAALRARNNSKPSPREQQKAQRVELLIDRVLRGTQQAKPGAPLYYKVQAAAADYDFVLEVLQVQYPNTSAQTLKKPAREVAAKRARKADPNNEVVTARTIQTCVSNRPRQRKKASGR
jgi:hypothetical protein